MHREALALRDVDVVVTGEAAEWEICEYVRDAVGIGLRKALVVIGHEKREEPGMRYLTEWLRPLLDGIPITHIPAGEPFNGAGAPYGTR